LGEARLDLQHVVPVRRDPPQARGPRLPELALDAVACDGRTDGSRDGEPEARLARILFSLERIEDQEASRHGATLAVDGVEVARAGESVSPLHGLPAHAESRLRPFALRRFRIAWPARVAMRARNPCLRLRLRTFGW